MTLWHFTCDHGRAGIGVDGWARPPREHSPDQPWSTLRTLEFLADVVWLTDQPDGFGSMVTRDRITGCNRTAHRYRVTDETRIEPWCRWARESRIDPATRWRLEGGDPGRIALPTSWYVSTRAVPVVLDER